MHLWQRNYIQPFLGIFFSCASFVCAADFFEIVRNVFSVFFQLHHGCIHTRLLSRKCSSFGFTTNFCILQASSNENKLAASVPSQVFSLFVHVSHRSSPLPGQFWVAWFQEKWWSCRVLCRLVLSGEMDNMTTKTCSCSEF